MTICATCAHPERGRVELEAAVASGLRSGSVARVAEKFGLKKDSVYRHLKEHMTVEQIARLRTGTPDDVEIDIDRLTREAGQNAVLGLGLIARELQETAEKCDRAGMHREATQARTAKARVLIEQAKMGQIYPTTKRETVNHNLIFANEQHVFALLDRLLRNSSSVAEARRMLAQHIRSGAQQVIEAEGVHVDD